MTTGRARRYAPLFILALGLGGLLYVIFNRGPSDSDQRVKATRIARRQIEESARGIRQLVRDEERARAAQFLEEHFTGNSIVPPFAFVYGDKPSADLLADWAAESSSQSLDENRTQHTLTFREPDSQLFARCIAVQYHDYPTIEWTVYLKNNGSEDTSIIEQLQGVDVSVNCPPPPATTIQEPRSWDAATDWSTEANGRGDWVYQQGWVAGWGRMTEVDADDVSGLEKWTHEGRPAPWIGKNVSEEPIHVDGTAVEPGQLVMVPAQAQVAAKPGPGSCPGLTWTCPTSGDYRLTGRLRNIGKGGNGIEWNLHDHEWSIRTSGLLNDQGEAPFELEGAFRAGAEFTLTFSDRGDTSGDLTEVDFLVEEVPAVQQGDVVLRYSRGSDTKATDYEPSAQGVSPASSYRFAAIDGRPTDGPAMPFFNLALKDNGLILAVGWPGQWASQFVRDDSESLRIIAGQERTRFKLRPGEEVRTPLVVMQFYNGNDWLRAQNVWRRWMLAHNLPKPGGQTVSPAFTGSGSHHYQHMENATEENQKLLIDDYLASGVELDYWLMDAGWYPNAGKWTNTGTWKPDPVRFPNGLRPISDHAREHNIKTIVWFEPERVTPGTELHEEHADWLLGEHTELPPQAKHQSDEQWALLNMGDAAAREWVTNRIDALIRDEGVDVYRQDFNIRPLYYWRAHDEPDRQGITENHYVSGYLAFWDELLRRHPNLLIDSCANGGGRNDLETMRRSVPLWRSDFCYDAIGNQCHTYGMAMWYPYFGTGITSPTNTSPYQYRSGMVPHASSSFELSGANLENLPTLYSEWTTIAPAFFGDFYPLTPYSADRDAWFAWQFALDNDTGVIQAFRRAANPNSGTRLQLRGLQPDRTYALKNLDTQRTERLTGAELMNSGLSIQISDRPGAAVITYQRQ